MEWACRLAGTEMEFRCLIWMEVNSKGRGGVGGGALRKLQQGRVGLGRREVEPGGGRRGVLNRCGGEFAESMFLNKAPIKAPFGRSWETAGNQSSPKQPPSISSQGPVFVWEIFTSRLVHGLLTELPPSISIPPSPPSRIGPEWPEVARVFITVYLSLLVY